ncbi:hypothetical protein ACIHFE_18170 [Streptomyces sp. NPDC052396]|uniref:hypothetical protein n=1 Tax=Streptomyces sp. NPDC052396 TaxID=3365689 RepID=UPI0037D4560E
MLAGLLSALVFVLLTWAVHADTEALTARAPVPSSGAPVDGDGQGEDAPAEQRMPRRANSARSNGKRGKDERERGGLLGKYGIGRVLDRVAPGTRKWAERVPGVGHVDQSGEADRFLEAPAARPVEVGRLTGDARTQADYAPAA